MRIRFIGSGDPTENAVCEIFGLSFPMNQWMSAPADVAERLKDNPTFEVEAFNGADPAAFDHDNNGAPGGSLPRRGRKPKGADQ